MSGQQQQRRELPYDFLSPSRSLLSSFLPLAPWLLCTRDPLVSLPRSTRGREAQELIARLSQELVRARTAFSRRTHQHERRQRQQKQQQQANRNFKAKERKKQTTEKKCALLQSTGGADGRSSTHTHTHTDTDTGTATAVAVAERYIM